MATEDVPYNLTPEQVIELWDGYAAGQHGRWRSRVVRSGVWVRGVRGGGPGALLGCGLGRRA
jgi:hypothetical protein